MMQQFLGLATIETINRGNPVKHTVVKDVPVEFADEFYKWYMGRRNEITAQYLIEKEEGYGGVV